MRVYKIFRRTEWAHLAETGATDGAPIDVRDGFIHFSTADQVAETAAKHFAGEAGLVLVAVESERHGDALRWEPSRGGQLFPHLYGRLSREDVLWHADLPLKDGRHVFPELDG